MLERGGAREGGGGGSFPTGSSNFHGLPKRRASEPERRSHLYRPVHATTLYRFVALS